MAMSFIGDWELQESFFAVLAPARVVRVGRVMTKTDVQLKHDINQELARGPQVNAAQIAVSVDDGVVAALRRQLTTTSSKDLRSESVAARTSFVSSLFEGAARSARVRLRSSGTELAAHAPMDPLYFDRVLELALLSHAEENALARRWRKYGDQAARNSLIQAHLRLVPPIARRYFRPGASLSELVAEGNFGLLRASAKFEPQRGYRFATYARYWIRACVAECAIRNSGTVMRMPRTLRKVRREHARAVSLVGDGVDVRRIIAERLRMNSRTVDDLVGLLHRRQVSFESLHSEWHTDEPLYAQEVSPEQAMVTKSEQQHLEEAVRAALASLTARERRIVDRRLMVDSEAILTLKELGDEFGVSRERVRQLEVNIKRKLVTHLRALSETAEAPAPKVAA